MAKKYEKTAKDKAWDRERTKLVAEIYKKKNEFSALASSYQQLKVEKIKLEDENTRLRELLAQLTSRKPEDIIKDIDDSKAAAKHVLDLITLGGFFN